MIPKSILIIDDDRDIVDAIETILLLEDYHVSHAYSGKEGMEKARDERPQLILLDFMLPDFSGKEVSEQLRSYDSLKEVPIILISAAKEAHELAHSLNISAFIEKPFEMDYLLSVVSNYLS